MRRVIFFFDLQTSTFLMAVYLSFKDPTSHLSYTMAGSEDSEALLRVHSKDLHEHIAQEVGECLESGLYTDLMIRCNNGQTLHGHKLVLSAVSPYLKWVSN